MGSPTPSSALSTLRPDLASFMEFDAEMDRKGFIGLRVAPVVEVALQADNPGKVPVEQLLQSADVKRSASGGYNRGSIKFDKWSYATEEYGREEVLTDRLVRQYRHLIDAEVVASKRARDIVLREAEKRYASLLFNTTTWTGSSLFTNVSTEWSTAASADPYADVKAARIKVFEQTGLWPNALIIDYLVFMNLRACAKIIDRIESSGAGQATKPADITADLLARTLDLDQVIVARAGKNTADEGQSAAMSQIWDDEYAMVACVATSNDVQEPCVARTFHWSDDGSDIGAAIEEYYSNETRSKIIRARHDTDEVVMYAESAHLLGNITA